VENRAKTERRAPAPAARKAAVPASRGDLPRPLPYRASGPLAEFLHRVGPKAERLLTSYRLGPAQAEKILSETLQVLVWKWEAVRDREAWLLAVLEGRCRSAGGRPTAGRSVAASRREPDGADL
jgi:hypothetical protein